MDSQREKGDADLKFDFKIGGSGYRDPPPSLAPLSPTSMIEWDDDGEEKDMVLIRKAESSGDENLTPIAMDSFAPTTMMEEFAAASVAGLAGGKHEKDGDLGFHMEVAAAGLYLDKQEKDLDSRSQMEVDGAKEEEEEKKEEEAAASHKRRRSPMAKRYWKEYLRQVEESEGFDVDYFPGRPVNNLLAPAGSPYNDDWSIEIGQIAIDHYNKKKDGQLKLERVVKIIMQIDGWHRLYVTLEAFDAADQQVKTYQALLVTIPQLGGNVLKMFRLKPSSSETQHEKKHPLGGCCGECYRKEEDACCGESYRKEEDACPKSKSCHSPPLKKAKIDSSDEVEEESDFGDFTVKQKQDTRSPSHSSGDDQDEDEEPPGNNPEEFACGSYIEFIEALNERDNRLFTNVPSEVALQNIKELIEKEAGCSEEVKYTLEDVETYYEELEESEGFNITHFPDMDKLLCFVTPAVPPWDDCVTKHVELAIVILNKKEGASFELLEITMVNYLKICCPHSYITFNVKDGADGEPRTCQARVLTIPGREKVEEVRLKPCKS